MEKHWHIYPRITPEADQGLKDFPAVLRQILFNRGYATLDDAQRFLFVQAPLATDPFLLSGMTAAVSRIWQAIQRREPVAIYGDYDVDGVTATALLVQILEQSGAIVQGYIPNRFDEGYGLNTEALDSLYAQGVRLVITVDCGIRSIIEAEHAVRLGLDLIITDHHHPADQIPQAVAVINPKLPGDAYPDKDLAGVGVAYKLASALMQEVNPNAVEPMLDLVALGTVADMAPLVGENRFLVRSGLSLIRQQHRQGVLALIASAGLNAALFSATNISFGLAPRLNAAGRLDTALAAYRLLTTSAVAEAAILAQQLEILNRERQEITRNIQATAEQLALADDPNALLLIAAHPEFNPGVVGLGASRLVEQYYRPAIIASIGEEFTRASCRSIPEFHITKALDQCADLMEHHGGHAAAAGFTIRNERFPSLITRLKAIAAQELGSLDLRPVEHADLVIPLSELKPDILNFLEWLQPTGYGNPPVYFVSRNLKITRSHTVGKDGAHLKMSVSDGRITYDSIAFRQGQRWEQLPARVDLLYAFEKNLYNGRVSMQLNVRDIKPSE